MYEWSVFSLCQYLYWKCMLSYDFLLTTAIISHVEFHKEMFVAANAQQCNQKNIHQDEYSIQNRSIALSARYLFQYLGPSTVLLVSGPDDPVLINPEVIGIQVITIEAFLDKLKVRVTDDLILTESVERLVKECRETLQKHKAAKQHLAGEVRSISRARTCELVFDLQYL